MHEVQDEPLFAYRVAGLDIARAMVEVTIRVPAPRRRAGASRRPGRSAPPGPSWSRWRLAGCRAGGRSSGSPLRRNVGQPRAGSAPCLVTASCSSTQASRAAGVSSPNRSLSRVAGN